MTDYLARTCGRIVLAMYGTTLVTAMFIMVVKVVWAFKMWWRRVTGW